MQEDHKPNYKQEVIKFFNSRTAYDSEGDSHPQEAKHLLEYVQVKSGQTILDLATGTGLVAIPAAKAAAPGTAIGVDIASGMLAQAQEKIVAQGIRNLELIEADAELIDFPNEQFDLIFCCSALVYISDIPAMIAKCYRWLKPGGYLAFTTPNKSSYLADLKVQICQDLFDMDLPHIIRPLWTSKACSLILGEAGFQNIEIEQYQFRKYRIDQNYGAGLLAQDFYPRGNPLLNLSQAQQKLLQAEYNKAIDSIITKQGVWQSAFNFFVKASK
ncbi:MAG: class I SAM-dependent methyltransferase [Cyanobacteria bacterium J06621_8]